MKRVTRLARPRLTTALTAALLALALGATFVEAASFRALTTDAGNAFTAATLASPTAVQTSHANGLSPATVSFTPPSGSIASGYQVQRATASAGPYTVLTTLPVTASSSAADFSAASQPNGATAGPDGNVWFTEKGANKVAKVTAAGTVTAYALTSGASPAGITTGPDGRMWFAENGLNKIGVIKTDGTGYTEYAAGTGSGPQGIAAGADGRLWFTEMSSNKIATIKTDGTGLLEIGGLATGAAPYDVTAGPDGDLWFTESGAANIGRVASTLASSSPTVQEIAIASSRTYGITTGPDGNVWFADRGNNKVGKVATFSDSATSTPAEFGTGISASANLQEIVPGPDGRLWVTENGQSKIAKVTTAGAVTEMATASVPAGPAGIAAGPDGNVWYTEQSAGRVARQGTNAGGLSSYVDTTATYGSIDYYQVVSVLSSWTAASAAAPTLTWEANAAGSDTTGSQPYTLTSTDLGSVAAIDKGFYTAQAAWAGSINENNYVELDAGSVPSVTGSAPRVVLTLAQAISGGTLSSVRVEVWDGAAWQAVSGFAAPTTTFSTQSVDISSVITTWAKVQTLKVRVLAAKSTGSPKAEIDVASVAVN